MELPATPARNSVERYTLLEGIVIASETNPIASMLLIFTGMDCPQRTILLVSRPMVLSQSAECSAPRHIVLA